MRRVFSSDSPNLKKFSWVEAKGIPVNSKESEKNQPKHMTRPKEELKIQRVLTPQEEKILENIEKEKNKLKENIREELKKEIEKEKKEYQYFKIAFEELEKIKQEAYEKGYKEGLEKGKSQGEAVGYKSGLEKAQKEYEEKLSIFTKNLMTSIENIELFKEKTLNNAKADTLELAVIMAKKIINKEISLNPEAFISIIEDSLKNITAKDKLNIFLNNEDYNIVLKEGVKLANDKKITISTDSELKRGEIKIISDLEQLSYSIEENIEKLKKRLKDELL